MKALVVDAAASCMTIAAKNDDIKATLSLDMGQKQSQKLLPAIDYVLSQVELTTSKLDYMALTSGPGTFTGLRLAFSALKAIELATNTPIYGVPTLDCYAFPYSNFDGTVVSIIDAKKDQFFAAIYKNGAVIQEAADTTAEKVAGHVTTDKKILLVGPDAAVFAEELKKIAPALPLSVYASEPFPTDSLFTIAEKQISDKKPPLADYDGPVYLRKSEAEIKLESESQK